MNDSSKNSLFFIAGAAISSFITYKMVEKKYKDIADEEIASVKEMYERKLKNKEQPKCENNDDDKTTSIASKDKTIRNNPYSSLVNDLGYLNNKKEEKSMDDDNIEIIPPEEFGEYGYKCESLTYYADKILTFDNDEEITDINKFIGSKALNTFGEYEDDSVFVRNHKMKIDFEILLDSRRYSDVISVYPLKDTDDE